MPHDIINKLLILKENRVVICLHDLSFSNNFLKTEILKNIEMIYKGCKYLRER